MPDFHAEVEQVAPLSDSILQVRLKPDHKVSYLAGHYLELIFDGRHYPFSIANAPLGGSMLELHIRHSQGEPESQHIVKLIRNAERLQLRAPCGQCTVEQLTGNDPLIFIAGGTGFAPIKAMIEALLAEGCQRVMTLYWSAKQQGDLYMDDVALKWEQRIQQFSYVQCLSLGGDGKRLEQRIMAEQGADLMAAQVVMAGPFPMVYQLRDSLLAHGLNQSQLFSDAFDFEEKQ